MMLENVNGDIPVANIYDLGILFHFQYFICLFVEGAVALSIISPSFPFSILLSPSCK